MLLARIKNHKSKMTRNIIHYCNLYNALWHKMRTIVNFIVKIAYSAHLTLQIYFVVY